MKRLIEDTRYDNDISSSSFTNNFNLSTSSSTDNCNTRSSDVHIYEVAVVAVSVIGACVFFPYNKKFFQIIA